MEAVKKFQEKCEESNILIKIERETGDPFESMIVYARYMDFIVMGNSIRNLMFRHLLGDTVLNAIQQSDRPLFLEQ